jgi:hypothetical protein
MQPNLCNRIRKELEIGAVRALRAVDVTQKTPGWISSTEKISPLSSHRQVNILV